jgi:hypothetical protein
MLTRHPSPPQLETDCGYEWGYVDGALGISREGNIASNRRRVEVVACDGGRNEVCGRDDDGEYACGKDVVVATCPVC